MMATYFNGGGGSEIQSDNLQTLYLMNRGYAPSFPDAPQHPPPGGVQVLLNHPAHNHHLLGIPLSTDDPTRHYNRWGGADIPTAIAINAAEIGSPMGGFRRPAPVTLIDHQQQQQQQQRGLSLSLNNSPPTSSVTTGVAPSGSPGLISGSKYLKAAQQLLDEAVNVGKAMNYKAKGSVGEGPTHGGGAAESTGGAIELTTAQRQELQMKKSKLLNMLDEVEQRYRQYHTQMQMVVAGFEQVAGGGSAKSYTALALQTISRQFRCLRDAIGEQIKGVGKSMGEVEDEVVEEGRSRLRMVDHQLRQQRAMQQLGMMHHNAWRPQRGLPERAVSVLRAWLFEHFLHPYPKDSDKHLLAKQTGLTRSQVSNWFINARVRLWKPMVEEMYVEEMKSNEQNGSTSNNNNNNTIQTQTSKDSTTCPKSTGHNSSRHAHHPINEKPDHNYNQNPQAEMLGPPPPNTMEPLQGFTLAGPSDMSPKRQRMMISPSEMDNELKPPIGHHLFPPDLGGFGSYPIGEIGSRYNPEHHHNQLQLGHQHQPQYHHGNTVSLTLGLPRDSGQGLSLAGNHHHQQQQNFLHGHQGMNSTDAGGGYDFVT